MLNKVTIKNFRQHEELVVDFTDGVTVVRGENEAGKSTIFEAISYAMFGIKACRDNDVSTWGKTANSQRVEVEFSVGDIIYKVYRTAKSTELNSESLKVSGQSDVTRRCEELLDLKPGTGEKLMFVPQNKMRGILDEGGAKTTSMIEQLADIGVIEAWIEKLQDNYPTGSTQFVELELQHAQEKYFAAVEAMSQVQHPEKEVAEFVKSDKEAAKNIEAEISNSEFAVMKLKSKADAAHKTAKLKEAAHEAWEEFERDHSTLTKQISSMESFLASVSSDKPCENKLSDLRAALEGLKFQNDAHLAFASLHGYVPTITEMSLVQIQAALKESNSTLKETEDRYYKARAAVDQLRGGIITGSTCKTCGTVLKTQEEVDAHNSKIEGEIEITEKTVTVILECIGKDTEQRDKYQAWSQLRDPDFDERFWKPLGYQHPVSLVWVGPENHEDCAVQLKATELEVKKLQSEIDAYESAQSKAEAQRQQLAEAKQQLADLKPVDQVLWVEVKAARQSAEDASRAVKGAESELEDLQLTLKGLKDRIDNPMEYYQHLFDSYKTLEDSVKTADEEVKRYQTAIEDMGLNTELLKYLRKMKPQVANQVWQSVCQSVSHYFSIMRGQQSIVTKEDGFTVDGHNVSSLSGSTLDVLGIAIRVALTKTFMPTCRFLLLDEPFAACSSERQEQALGFITSCGFDQIIIVTHEDTTQAVADNLVSL